MNIFEEDFNQHEKAKEIKDKEQESAKNEVEKFIDLFASYLPEMKEVLESKGYSVKMSPDNNAFKIEEYEVGLGYGHDKIRKGVGIAFLDDATISGNTKAISYPVDLESKTSKYQNKTQSIQDISRQHFKTVLDILDDKLKIKLNK